MNPLQQIPARIRTRLYWVGYVVGAVSQGIALIWGIAAASSPTISMPLWLVLASAGLAFLQTQLNLVAGSNVSLESNTVSLTTPSTIQSVSLSATADNSTPGDASARRSERPLTGDDGSYENDLPLSGGLHGSE